MAERSRRLRLGLALAVLTTVVCGVILEAGIRLDDWRRSGKPPVPQADLALAQENPAGTGSYRLRPNLNLETRIGANNVKITTNAHGMPWRETSLKGDPTKRRVAFLGDSFTFGCWASDWSRSFVGVFEKSLPGDRYEALNFGVGGYGLADEELILKELALQFDPSYVVVVSYMGNDFPDTWLGIRKDKVINGTAVHDPEVMKERIPAEYLAPDDTNPIPCPATGWRRVAQHSAAFRRLAPILDLEDLCVRFRPNHSFFRPAFWSTLPVPPIVLEAKTVVEETLGRMEDLTASHNAKLVVVAMPTAAQVYAEEPSRKNFDTALPQAYLQTFCRDRRIPYLDLLPLLREQAARSNKRLYLNRDIHLTDFGHARVGEMIAAWFDARVAK